jgi:hypothetical protein
MGSYYTDVYPPTIIIVSHLFICLLSVIGVIVAGSIVILAN